jgi:hypothetical protein
MKMRLVVPLVARHRLLALATLLLVGTMGAAPPAAAQVESAQVESAQTGPTETGPTEIGPNTSGSSCNQTATGGGTATGGAQSDPSRGTSQAALVQAIVVAVDDVLNNVQLDLNALNGADVQLVCLNDVLNQNDLEVLSHVLTDSPVLSHNRDVLSHNLRDLLNANNVAANVQVVSVSIGSPTVFLLA